MTNTIHSDLIRGHINTIILKTLYEGDKYGYDIVRAIEQKSNGQYKMKQPTLYSCLKRLENQGLVTAYWGARSNGGRRRYYALTETGTQEFLKDQADWAYSKTLIDKLITSDALDFEAVTRELEEEGKLDNSELFIEQASEFDEEDIEEELSETTTSIESDSIILEESLIEPTPSVILEEPLIAPTTETKEEVKINNSPLLTEKLVKFVDTTAIMNSLINNQLDAVDSSYVDKIIAEKYTPKSTQSSINYFKDFESEYADDDETLEDKQSEKDTAANILLIPTKAQEVLQSSETENDEFVSTESILDKINQKYNDLRVKSEANNQIIQKKLANMPPPTLSLYDIERQNLEKTRDLSEKNALITDKNSIFISYDSLSPAEIDEKKVYIAREYKNILSALVKNKLVDFKIEQAPVFVQTPITAAAPVQNIIIPAPAYKEETDIETLFKPFEGDEYEVSPIEALTRDREVNKKFNKLTSSVRELGDNVKIRTHSNDSSKEYNSEYYYYSNKLMLVHYGILFGIMVLEVIFSFLFIRVGLNLQSKYDIWVYLLGILTAVVFPFAAFLSNLYNPKKKKRIGFNFKSSMIIRILAFSHLILIIYFVNVMLQMPLFFSIDYLASLLLPALLVTNVPISALIFNFLYKTKKYSVEM